MARKPGRSHKQSLYRRLLDPKYAAGYINAAFEEDGEQGLLGALSDVVKARGAKEISRSSEVSRSGLHQITSQSGNPTTHNLLSILKSLGLGFEIKPVGRRVHVAFDAAVVYGSRGADSTAANYATLLRAEESSSDSTIWGNVTTVGAHA